MKRITKFVSWDVQPLTALKKAKAYIMRERIDSGGTLTREDKNWLTEAVNTNTYFKDSVPVMGWRFRFDDILRKFWVQQHGVISEYFAVDKTALKAYLGSGVSKIVEISTIPA